MSDQEQNRDPKKGLAKMSEVYGWEMSDGPGDSLRAHLRPGVRHGVDPRRSHQPRPSPASARRARRVRPGRRRRNPSWRRAVQRRADPRTSWRRSPCSPCYYVGWPPGRKMHFMFGNVIKNFEKTTGQAAE